MDRISNVVGPLGFDLFLRGGLAIVVMSVVVAAFRRSHARAAQRLAFWGLALLFTFYGPFSSVQHQWPLYNWAWAINEHNDFKDIWLALIGMLVLSLSNTADRLLRNYARISQISQVLVPFVCAAYVFLIGAGMANYAEFSKAPLIPAMFDDYWTWCVTGLAIGAFVELLIVVELGE